MSIGRSVVFVTQEQQPADILHILEEQHCEVILLKHSRLSQLEEALQCSYCSSLRVVLFTDDDYIDKARAVRATSRRRVWPRRTIWRCFLYPM